MKQEDIKKTLRLPFHLNQAVENISKNEERSWNSQIIVLLREHPLIKAELEKINQNKNTKQN